MLTIHDILFAHNVPAYIVSRKWRVLKLTLQGQSLQSMTALLHTHIHPFNGPFSGTTQVSQYQKGKTNLDFTEARDSEWQWHQLGCMQICTSLQTDNQSTPLLFFYRPDALPAAQPTASKHWRQLPCYSVWFTFWWMLVKIFASKCKIKNQTMKCVQP